MWIWILSDIYIGIGPEQETKKMLKSILKNWEMSWVWPLLHTKADALLTLTTIKTGIASSGFTGTGSTLGSAAHVAKVEDSTAFVTATANDCNMIFIDKCIELYPTKCKLQESGAINAIASLGAATIALVMLF